MIHQRIWITGPLPDLNYILDQRATVLSQKRSRRYDGYTKLKHEWGNRVKIEVLRQRFIPVYVPAHFTYCVVAPSTLKDPSNICSGAVKIIEDGLQAAGVIRNDDWTHVLGIRLYWIVDKEFPGCLLNVGPAPCEQSEMLTEVSRAKSLLWHPRSSALTSRRG